MTMLDYIKEQGMLFRQALADRDGLTKAFTRLYSDGRPEHIVLVASGTSYNACLAAAPFMERILDVDVSVKASSRHGGYRGRTLVMYVSQGGNSTNTIKAIEEDAAPLSIAVTGNKDGRVNEICAERLEIPCGVETVGPKTKGYTMTILLLQLCALEAACATGRIDMDGYGEWLRILGSVAGRIDDNVTESERWVERNLDLLKGMKTLYVVGRGVDQAVACEGALKVLETFLIPASSWEFEEFLHGPSCSISSTTSAFYLPPMGCADDAARMARLAAYNRKHCPATFSIGGGDGRDAGLVLSGNVYMTPYEYIIPLQVASAIVPGELGIQGEGSKRFKELDSLLAVKCRQEPVT